LGLQRERRYQSREPGAGSNHQKTGGITVAVSDDSNPLTDRIGYNLDDAFVLVDIASVSNRAEFGL
jgi:hypothetical protein